MENIIEFLRQQQILDESKTEFVIKYENGTEVELVSLISKFIEQQSNKEKLENDAITHASNTMLFLNKILHGLVNGANDEILYDAYINLKANYYDLSKVMIEKFAKTRESKMVKSEFSPFLAPVTVNLKF